MNVNKYINTAPGLVIVKITTKQFYAASDAVLTAGHFVKTFPLPLAITHTSPNKAAYMQNTVSTFSVNPTWNILEALLHRYMEFSKYMYCIIKQRCNN